MESDLSTIHLNYAHDGACPFNRFLLPARHCVEDMKTVGVALRCGDGLPEDCDWFGLHGIPGNAETVLRIGRLKGKGKKFLWSVDDDWLTVPDWNPAKLTDEGIGVYHICKNLADAIMVSTEALARTFADAGKPVYFAPNLVDLKSFPDPPWAGGTSVSVRTDAIKNVVWAGGRTHKNDVEVVEPAVRAVLRELGPSRVNFIFVGQMPPAGLVRDFLHNGVIYLPPLDFIQYRATVNALRPDIWLAPMYPCEFNKSKSNLRVMEGWALCSAVVATPFGEYNCVRDGVDGMLADGEDGFASAIVKLATDHPYRVRMAYEGRVRVESQFDWNRRECRLRWNRAWSGITGSGMPFEG